MMNKSNDLEIREAFHKKKLSQQHKNKDTLIIDELGLLHGSNRIDIAVIGKKIHGYEIKSAKDNLKRLEGQLNSYSRTLQKLTFVIAPEHLVDVMKFIPQWCGVIIAEKGVRGGITFRSIRKALLNPDFDKTSAAHLLWKNEAQFMLSSLGYDKKSTNKKRIELYKLISQSLSTNELVGKIKETLSTRENWRAE